MISCVLPKNADFSAPMRTILFSILITALAPAVLPAAEKSVFAMDEFATAPHLYWEKPQQDRFSKMIAQVAAGKAALDLSNNTAFLLSLLKALEIPVSSQLLVFSGSSLQKRLINSRNPRALYFNEDTFVGFVPGGRIEIASLDPELGLIFSIFDPLRGGAALPTVTRPEGCLNCHAEAHSYRLPGVSIESLAVDRDGSSLETYRRGEIGHMVPLADRFGGWHLTGGHGLASTRANFIGSLSPAGMARTENPVGKFADVSNYPVATSDILPHLIHEHLSGFLNRLIQLRYLERRMRMAAQTSEPDRAAMQRLVDEFADYLLFKDEAALPSGGVTGEPTYQAAFLERYAGSGLGQFDLKSRIFRLRCSYLLGTEIWKSNSPGLQKAISSQLGKKLAPETASHLTKQEKAEIRNVLTKGKLLPPS
jgi:hypothetical protein